MKYELTIDDPDAPTATWKTGWYLSWSPGVESFEFVCQDNKQASGLMVGSMEGVDRNNPFIP